LWPPPPPPRARAAALHHRPAAPRAGPPASPMALTTPHLPLHGPPPCPPPFPQWYPADDVPKPVTRKFKPKTAKLRAGITPGTVLILLSGRFAGKRVVFLKQLDSGLLLINGPYAVNKVPLRRVDQAYVIATTTKVPLPAGLDLSPFNDKYFAAKGASAKLLGLKGGERATAETAFFAAAAKKGEVSQERADAQAKVDKAIALSPELQKYLKSRFSLSNKQRPHEMKF